MSKKKPIKTEWNQDDRRDLSDMTKEEIKEFSEKLIDAFVKAYKIPKKYFDPNQNKDDEK
jgi:hypothetical protein